MASQTIELPLPEGVDPSAADLELLRTLLQVLLTMRLESCEQKQNLVQTIEHSGWSVRLGVSWVAEARRGQDYEQTTGKTPVEALTCLYNHTQMAKLEGCP